MQAVNSDILSHIIDFLPLEEIKPYVSGFYELDSTWKNTMYRIIKKEKIYKYFDLGRDNYIKFCPFSQVTFGQIVTVEQRKKIIEDLYDWVSNIITKKINYNKNILDILLEKPIIDIKNKEIINPSWNEFFTKIRTLISAIPFSFIIDNPDLTRFGYYYRKTEKDFLKEPQTFLFFKQMMKLSWSWRRFTTENGYTTRHDFYPEIWNSIEEIIAFMENRPKRNSPYNQLNYILNVNDSDINNEGYLSENITVYNRNTHPPLEV